MFPSDSDDKTALEDVPAINFYHTTGWPQTQHRFTVKSLPSSHSLCGFLDLYSDSV